MEKPSESVVGPAACTQHLHRMRSLIADLMGENFLSRTEPGHPARVMHDASTRLSKGFELGEPTWFASDLPILGIASRLCASLATASGSGVSEMRLGTFANYGDDDVRKRLRSDIFNPDQFLDVLAEIQFAALLMHGGAKITASQAKGMPDFRIDVPGLDRPIIADCKRVRPGSAHRAIKDDITNANRQIKRSGVDGYGLVLIDASDYFNIKNGSIDDGFVVAAERYAKLKGSISSHNRSVSGVILAWDFFWTKPFPNDPTEQMRLVVSGVNSNLYRHQNPLNAIPPSGLGVHASTMHAHVVELRRPMPDVQICLTSSFPQLGQSSTPNRIDLGPEAYCHGVFGLPSF